MTSMTTSLGAADGTFNEPAGAAHGADREAARSAEQVPRLLARLDELEPEFEREIDGNERAGKLSDRTVELLRAADIPRLLLPEDLGGLGMFPLDALTVVERLCRIDSSIGWIGGNWSSTGVVLSYLDTDTAKSLARGGLPLFGVSGAPTGQALPVDGGHRLSGGWSYGSGDLQADYTFCSAVQLGPDGQPLAGPGGVPVIRMYMIPGAAVIDRGNWDTLGLRATGSIDFAADDVFIPEEHVVDLFGPPRGGGRQLAGGFLSFLPYLHTGFALGATRRLLDELILFAGKPSSRGTALADDVLFRSELARHEVRARSARAFVMEAWQDVDRLLKSGTPLPRRTTTLLRASTVHTHDVLREVALFAFQRAGGTSLRAGVLQRWVRDALSGCQHLIASDAVYPDVARELMGAPENLVWGPWGLIPLP